MKARKGIIDQIIVHAEREAPIEACGYLAGVEGLITLRYPMTNVDQREDHFSFDPKEQFTAHKTAREDGVQLLGVYHSHPATPARPSEEDIRLAYNPSLLYVIVSLFEGKRTVKAFRIIEGKVEEEPLTIEE